MIPYRTLPEITIGPLTVYTFGVLMAGGVLVGFSVVGRLARRRRLSEDRLRRLGLRMVIGGVLGARASYVVTNWREIVPQPWKIIAVWDGGLHFFGGLAIAVVVLLVALRRGTSDPGSRLVVCDVFATALAAGLAIGRLGCFAVGEHLGRPTDFAIGAKFLGGKTIEPVEISATVFVPALYEAAVLAVVALVSFRAVALGQKRPGWTLGTVVSIVGVNRLLLDFLRVNDDRVMGLTGAQIAAAVMAIIGAAVATRTMTTNREARSIA